MVDSCAYRTMPGKQKIENGLAKHALAATAIHEAAHAVTAHFEGIGIGRRGVTIIPRSDYGDGMCSLPGLFNKGERHRLTAERYALILAAGRIAQRRFDPHTFRRTDSSFDHKLMGYLLGCFAGNKKEHAAYIRLVKARAEQAVNLHWPLIEALAIRLLERKHLSGREAQTFIRNWLARHNHNHG